MNCIRSALRVAVVGAGVSGTTCARELTSEGCTVQLVDKSRASRGLPSAADLLAVNEVPAW